MANKKTELPVFTLVEMSQWKGSVLRFMCKLMMIPGNPWVITVENTDLVHNEKSYLNKKSKKKLNV
jgi:hypothetical protein